MEILLIHSIYQAQFRDDLNELLTKKFKLKEEKDVVFDYHKHFAFKGRIDNVRNLKVELKKIVEGNYSFDIDDKIIMYFIDTRNRNVPKLIKKKII